MNIKEMYVAFELPLRRYIAHRVKRPADVDEILQEVFFRLLNRGESTPIGNPEAYLKTIARRVIYDRRKRAQKQNAVPFTAAGQEEIVTGMGLSSPEAAVDSAALLKKVQSTVPPEYVKLYALNRYDGQSYTQIAQNEGFTRDRVKYRILKVRNALRKLLLGVAFIALLLGGVLGFRTFQARGATLTQVMSTKPGERFCRTLQDESDMCLESDTSVRVVFSQVARNVEVLRGKVSFVVQNDPRRPFEVLSGRALILDLGTGFTVLRKPDSTRIEVHQGHIKVDAPVGLFERARLRHGLSQNTRMDAPVFEKSQGVLFDETTGTLQPFVELSEPKNGIDINGRTLDSVFQELSGEQLIQFEYPPSVGSLRLDGNMDTTDLDKFMIALGVEFRIHAVKRKSHGITVISLSKSPESLQNRRRPPK